MQRIFGALAVFGAWICLPLSAFLGLVDTHFLGLTMVEGPLPSFGVFGIPELVILGLLGTATVLGTVPIGTLILSPRPGRWVQPTAVAAGALGILLLFDDLGRAHAVAIIPGAFLLGLGGKLLEQAGDEETATAHPKTATVGPVAVEAAAAEPAMPEAAQAAGPRKPGRRAKRKADPSVTTDATPTRAAVCPWCSKPIQPGSAQCPECGAALTEAQRSTEDAIPGVTAVAPELLDYMARSAGMAKKPGLLAMLMGERDDRLRTAPIDAGAQALAPPSAEVRAAMSQIEREIAASSARLDRTAAIAEPASESGPPAAASEAATEGPAAPQREPEP